MKVNRVVEYKTLLETRATPWGHLPSYAPLHHLVHHLCCLIIRAIEQDSRGDDNLSLTESEVRDWLKAFPKHLIS